MISVLYEDSGLLVVDKPVGISVVTEDTEDSSTVREWVKNRYNLQQPSKGAEDEFEHRLGIVHRLDKETSGVLLIAKTAEVFTYLKGLFKFRRVLKEYQVGVYGNVKEDRFEISAPIKRDQNSGFFYGIDPRGRESVTDFTVKSRFQLNSTDYSYLIASPKTGRTHQIRVHLKAFGHPVVNDKKYASSQFLRLSENAFSRMLLHAKRISFVDWANQERVFESTTSLFE